MKYIIKNMDENILMEIISWKYSGPYSVYNMESYEELKARDAGILKPEKSENYLCFFNENKLIGYTNTIKRPSGELFLGIGLAPMYCGKGLGEEILRYTIDLAKNKYPNSKITLQVRSWNRRAIKCYEKAGFSIIKIDTQEDHNGVNTEFVFMEYIL